MAPRTKVRAPLLDAAGFAGAYQDDTRDVELPGGVTVRVRGLRKREQMRLARDFDPEDDAFQIELFRMGVVTDGEEMTTDQANAIFDQWPAGAFDAVLTAIAEVSGMTDTFREGHEG